MSKRNIAVEYIRGIAMLGVIGIHTGAYSLSNPAVNIHLFALLEILSRFSVPIFFFVSAFGLFCQHKPQDSLDYSTYFWHRCRTVVIPYICWSFLYIIYQTWMSHSFWQWTPGQLFQHLFFGLASYQLYFLVILIWFYILMPLWRVVLPLISTHPIRNLALILVAQIAFNYYSSYILQSTSANIIIQLALQYRMSYWVLHYVFIFLLGGVCALRYPDFAAFLHRHRLAVYGSFAFTGALMLTCYYWLLFVANYAPGSAVDTIHQLSPAGVLYTLAATLFCLEVCSRLNAETWTAKILDALSRYSYPIYLVHPLIMYYLVGRLTHWELIMTTPIVIGFYLTTVTASLVFSMGLRRLSQHVPLVGMLLTGTYPSLKQRE